MKYALCYDIENDKRRRGVSKLLEGYGYRVQMSVFEAFLSRHDLEDLKKRLVKIISKKHDQVRIYPLCANCDGSMIVLGNGERIEEKAFLVL